MIVFHRYQGTYLYPIWWSWGMLHDWELPIRHSRVNLPAQSTLNASISCLQVICYDWRFTRQEWNAQGTYSNAFVSKFVLIQFKTLIFCSISADIRTFSVPEIALELSARETDNASFGWLKKYPQKKRWGRRRRRDGGVVKIWNKIGSCVNYWIVCWSNDISLF